MRVAIGSENPVKISAVKKAFKARIQDEIEFIYLKVSSGVSDQPFGDEARQGAYNRAQAACQETGADYGVGLEGGIEIRDGESFANAWCAIVDKRGKASYAQSFNVPLPKVLMDKIKEGKELGEAQDELLGRKNTKHQEGFFGFATDNLVTREHGYIDMILAALAPIVLTKYYSK